MAATADGWWGILLLLVAMGPLWYRGATLAEVTVLAAGNDAVMVVQAHRSSLLNQQRYWKKLESTRWEPFLRQAGINRLSTAG